MGGIIVAATLVALQARSGSHAVPALANVSLHGSRDMERALVTVSRSCQDCHSVACWDNMNTQPAQATQSSCIPQLPPMSRNR